jgi:outer membrane protein insertion porin family
MMKQSGTEDGQGDMQMTFPWRRFSRMVVFLVWCLLIPAIIQGEEERSNVAVLPFGIYTSEPMDHLKEGFQEILSLHIAKKGLTVINPDVVNRYPKAYSSVLEEKDLYAMGKDLNADWVITGSITQIGDKISISLKLLDTTKDKPPFSLSLVEDDMDQMADIAERTSAAVYERMTGAVHIDSIQVKGNRRIETEAILSVIEIQRGDEIDPERLNRELRSIYRMGFFEDVSIETEDSPTGKIVTFVVTEKPSIAKIIFEGVKKGKEDELMEEAGIKVYSIVDRNEIRLSINRLKEYYRKKGYYYAEITEKIEELPDNWISLTYEINKGEKVFIRKIEFVGNHEFDDDDLKDIMVSREKGFFSWLTDSGRLDEKALEYDLLKISAFYQTHGFMKAMAGGPEISFDKKGVSVTIEITEGPRYRIHDVRVDGDLLGTAEELLQHVNITKEEFFNRDIVIEDKQALERIYEDEGYAYAEISPLTQEDDEKRLVDITYHIDKASKVRFERINIIGNTRTRDKVIRRELEVIEGEYFNGTAITKSTESLNRLGYFDNVEMVTRKGSEDDLMILDVHIEEKPHLGSLQFGVAYSDYEGLVGQVAVTRENLFGRGQSLGVSMYRGDRSKSLSLRFAEPWLCDKDISGSISVYGSKLEYYEYTTKSVGGALGVGFPLEAWGLGDLTRGSVRISHDNSDISDIEVIAAYVIKEMAGKNVTNSIAFGIGRDSRDRPLFTNKGSVNSFSIETAGGFLGGDVGFNKYQVSTEWYFPLPWSTVFVAKGTAGLIKRKEGNKLPVFQKYILGGPGSVRGFDEYSISPRDPVSGDRIRGEKMMFYNFEYRIPIREREMVGVVFFDAGNVWTEEQNYDFTDMRMAVGVGVMWDSPMGPLSIFFGKKLDPHRDESSSELQMGGLF